MNTHVLVLSTNYWHSLRFRKQRFAEMFAATGRKVLYVNPLFTLLSFIQDQECKEIFFDGFKAPHKVDENLWVATQVPSIPFRRRFSLINQLDMSLSQVSLARMVRALWGEDEYIQIVYSPEDSLRLRPTRKCRAVVYECVDEHAAYPWNQHRRSYIDFLERRLMSGSDLVTFTAKGLWDAKKDHCRNSVVLPNGVDLEKFSSAYQDHRQPEEIRDISPPILLYVGAIMEWFDWDLVRSCAQLRPEWQFVLVGPTNLPRETLRSVTNIHYLGTISPARVPDFIRGANVCLIPFKVNDLTVNVSPLKLYEYMAVGKPVVSVPLPEVVGEADPRCIMVASDTNGFIDGIERFLLQGSDPDACSKVARAHSWNEIFCKLNQELTNAGIL